MMSLMKQMLTWGSLGGKEKHLFASHLEGGEVKPDLPRFGSKFAKQGGFAGFPGHLEFIFDGLPVRVANQAVFASLMCGLADPGADSFGIDVFGERSHSGSARLGAEQIAAAGQDNPGAPGSGAASGRAGGDMQGLSTVGVGLLIEHT